MTALPHFQLGGLIVMIFKQKPSPAAIPVRAFSLGDFSNAATNSTSGL
jgi:hypothetical protein